MIQGTRTLDLPEGWSLPALAEAGRGPDGERVLFDGLGDRREAWFRPGLVALEPRCELRLDARVPRNIDRALERIDALLERRRDGRGRGGTGLAILLGYEALTPATGEDPFPSILVLSVDASIAVRPGVSAKVHARSETHRRVEDQLDRWTRRFREAPPTRVEKRGAMVASEVTTSLPRSAYVEAVRQLRHWIAEGRIYQANLCQRFDGVWPGDALDYYRRLSAQQTVPRSAFLSFGDRSLASFSPETFLTIRDGRVETLPIKGTRPRGATAEEDRRAIDDLLGSPKDRAELLMIVDLERNDLGRICLPGSVTVPELAAPCSYPNVHHLVARVRGRIREGVSFAEMIRAVFPGGSITGAPKISAMDCLRRLEPVERGPFTGSLFWCDDDGSVDSSILIRSVVFCGDRFRIGAGGGVVADSDPRSEWVESNHKARPLTLGLGFQPEDLA